MQNIRHRDNLNYEYLKKWCRDYMKNIHLYISSPPEEVKELVNELEPRGLIIKIKYIEF